MAKSKMKKKSGGSSEFAKRYGGAIGAGYEPDEAAAIAHGGSNKESSAESRLKEAFKAMKKGFRKV